MNDIIFLQKPGVLSCLPIAYKKIVVANRMKSLRKKLSKIIKQFTEFNFIRTQDTSPPILLCYDERETTSDSFPEVKGRDGEKKEIINLLLITCKYGQ